MNTLNAYALASCGLLLFPCLSGCGAHDNQVDANRAPEVPYSSKAEIDDLLRTSSTPVLVEFCVPVGCFRCDEMRPQVDDLAERQSGMLLVRRVNLNQDTRWAADMKISMCPTYVAFADGKEVFRTAYPTTSDLLESQLLALRGE